jgi:ubiquinone/menaquinone biosynthesis C-methylase UbiE
MDSQGRFVRKKVDPGLKHTCPWWFLFSFDNPLRRLYQDPFKILTSLISEGDRILDVGCGMGFLTIPAADLVGPDGEVVAVDLQQRMLDGLWRKARKADLQERIQLQLASQESIGVFGSYDLALAFWMVHEVRDSLRFLEEIYTALRPGGRLLIAEPYLHVSVKKFKQIQFELGEIGFIYVNTPVIGFSRTILVEKE